MKGKNELKEIDIKNRVCYCFDDIVNGTKINFSNNQMKIFQLITFGIKLQQIQNPCVLGSIK